MIVQSTRESRPDLARELPRQGPVKCLILAAGSGRRMKTFKPLVKVGGLPLIERVIVAAHEAGLRDFYVVTGHQGERLEAFLSELGTRRKLKITSVRNADWELDNGTSLLEGQRVIGEEEFLLLMGDHIVDEEIIKRMLREPMEGHEVILAVDSGIDQNRLVDIEDVTKVALDTGRIDAIGKQLDRFHAFDTGVFRCTPAVFAAAEESMAGEDGDTSLSGAIRLLAAQRKVKALDIRGQLWLDVDTPVDRKKAEAVLYESLGKPLDGFISTNVNRKLSTRVLTPALLRLWPSVTPNQVTLLGFAVSLLAGFSFLFGALLAGALLIQLASLLDGSDGEVARLKKLQSSFGGFFDAVLDRYGDGFIIFAMFYYALTSAATSELLGGAAEPAVLAAGVLAIGGSFMVSYTSAKSITDLGYQYTGGWIAAGRGRDLRLFILSVGGVGALLHPVGVLVALALVGGLTSAIVIRRAWLSWDYARGRSPFAGGRLSAVLFDFDGTIADTMPYLSKIAVDLLTSHYEVSRPQAMKSYLETSGLDFASQVESIFPDHGQNGAVVAQMEEQKRSGLGDNALFGDVVSTLRFFGDQGIRVFICSSTQETLVREFVTRAGIGALVEAAYGYQLGRSKGRQIEFVLAQHGIEAESAVFIGDSFADASFASAAGVRFIGLSRLFKAEDFRRRGLLSVPSLTALTALYGRWQGLLSHRDGG